MMQKRITQEIIDKLGGDWGGYGELTGPQVVTLLNQDKIRLVFGDKGIAVNLARSDGSDGTYLLKHTDIASF